MYFLEKNVFFSEVTYMLTLMSFFTDHKYPKFFLKMQIFILKFPRNWHNPCLHMEIHLDRPVGVECLAQYSDHLTGSGNHAVFGLEARPFAARTGFTQG